MKQSLGLIIFMLCFSTIDAQPCKIVEVGMGQEKVLKLLGPSTSKEFIGVDNKTDSLILWNYGNQQLSFIGGKIDRIVVDVKKENELLDLFSRKKITREELEVRIKKLNREGCK